jgi:hypothetical protein
MKFTARSDLLVLLQRCLNADWLFLYSRDSVFCIAAFKPLIARGKGFSGLKAALRTPDIA